MKCASGWMWHALSSCITSASDAAAACSWLPQLRAQTRAYAKQAGDTAAERWRSAATPELSRYFVTPPVLHMEGMPLPTALSWLRRRGPEVPASLMHKLFRQGQVRIVRNGRVTCASQGWELQDGDALMVPQAALKHEAAAPERVVAKHHLAGHSQERQRYPRQQAMQQVQQQDGQNHPQQQAAERPGTFSQFSSSVSSSQASHSAMPRATPEAVRSWLLMTQRDFFVINKPSGIAVQGPTPGNLADNLPKALGFGQQEAPRLVHRLDQRVSGAMLIARSADAAAWLSRALQSKPAAAAEAVAAKQEAGRARQRQRGRAVVEEAGVDAAAAGMYVQRTYWALVQGDLQGKRSGRLRSMLHIEGQPRVAITDYRVRAADEGIAWLELTPHTGRKHQLRIHCSKLLGAPIIGDYKYGYRDSVPDMRMAPRLTEFLAQHRQRDAEAGQGLPLVAAAQLAGARTMYISDGRSSDTSVTSSSREPLGAGDSTRHGSIKGGIAGAPLVPIFLHSSSVVVGRQRKAPVRATAPLPRYMKDLVLAMHWKLPSEAKQQRVPMRSVLVQPQLAGDPV